MLGYTNKRFIEELILVGLRLRGCIADRPTSARHPLRPGNSQFRFGFSHSPTANRSRIRTAEPFLN
jgi:hypothetical protein